MKKALLTTVLLLSSSLVLLNGCNEMDPVPEISGRTYLTEPINGMIIHEATTGDTYYIDETNVPITADEAEKLAIAKEHGKKMSDVHFVVTGDKILNGTTRGVATNFTLSPWDDPRTDEADPVDLLAYRYLNETHNWGTTAEPDIRPALEYYAVRLSAEAERVEDVYEDQVKISSGTSDYYDPYHKTYIQVGGYINVVVTLDPNKPNALVVEEVGA